MSHHSPPTSDGALANIPMHLHSQVINLYLKLLQEVAPRCHFCSTNFYEKLTENLGSYTYAMVKRWTTKVS